MVLVKIRNIIKLYIAYSKIYRQLILQKGRKNSILAIFNLCTCEGYTTKLYT